MALSPPPLRPGAHDRTGPALPQPGPLQARALRQAARELLLAQASDWPFILRTGTSPDYARKRPKDHLLRFTALYDQLTKGISTNLGWPKSNRATISSLT